MIRSRTNIHVKIKHDKGRDSFIKWENATSGVCFFYFLFFIFYFFVFFVFCFFGYFGTKMERGKINVSILLYNFQIIIFWCFLTAKYHNH